MQSQRSPGNLVAPSLNTVHELVCNFLKVIAPKLEQHGIKYLVRGGGPKALVGEPPKNRLVITEAKDMETVMAFWNDSKDGFQIATKYANGIRWYAAEGR